MQFLSVPSKETGHLQLADALTKYLKTSVSKQAERDGSSETTEAQILRNNAADRNGTTDEIKAKIIRYYMYLNALEKALPIGRERGGLALTFSWADAFQPRERSQSSSVAFEKAALLFNLGATATQDALLFDTKNDAGMKAAARRFQEAAGAFVRIDPGLVNMVPPPIPTDLGADCIRLLENLCLAQAQELTYLTAVTGGKLPSNLARIAKHGAVLYSSAQSAPESDALKRKLGRVMLSHLQCKVSLMEVLSLQHQGDVSIAADECGTQISFLQEAVRQIQAARREAKDSRVDVTLQARLAEVEAQLTAALTKANRENGTVFLQRVPDFSSLPPVMPVPMVRSLPLPTDLDSVDPRWFQYLRTNTAQEGRGLFGIFKAVGNHFT